MNKRNSKDNPSPNRRQSKTTQKVNNKVQNNKNQQNVQKQQPQTQQKQPQQQQNKQQQNQEQQQPQQQTKKVIKQGYEFLQVIGSGAFGTVYKVTKNNKLYAIKQLTIKKSPRYMQYVYNEIEIMKKLQSKYCVKCYETWEEDQFIFIVMELCDGGTLYTYIVNKQPNEKQCLSIFVQLLKGFQELHEKQILHRDLKPQNIFIQNPDLFKIADFGVAKPLDLGKSCVGTPYFMSPEIQKKLPHNYKTDLWSLGVILYFMLFKCYPFKGSKKLIVEIYQKTHPFFNVRKVNPQNGHTITQPMADLLSKILVWDVDQRISFQEVYDLDIIKPYFQVQEIKQSKIKYDQLEKSIIQDQNSSGNGSNNYLSTSNLKESQIKPIAQNNLQQQKKQLQQQYPIVLESNNIKPNMEQSQIKNNNNNQIMNQTMQQSIIQDNIVLQEQSKINNDQRMSIIEEQKQKIYEEEQKQLQELEKIRQKNLELQKKLEEEKKKEQQLKEQYEKKLKQKEKDFENAANDLQKTSKQIFKEEKKFAYLKTHSALINFQNSSSHIPSSDSSNNKDQLVTEFSRIIGPQLKIEEIISKQSQLDFDDDVHEISDCEDNQNKEQSENRDNFEDIKTNQDQQSQDNLSVNTQQQVITFSNLNQQQSANDLETFNPNKQNYSIINDNQSDKLSQQMNIYLQNSGVNNSGQMKNGINLNMQHLNQNYYSNIYSNNEQNDSFRNNSERSTGTAAFGQKNGSNSQIPQIQESPSHKNMQESQIKQQDQTMNNFSIIQEESSNKQTFQSNFSHSNKNTSSSGKSGQQLNSMGIQIAQSQFRNSQQDEIQENYDEEEEEQDQNQINQAIKQQEMFKSQIRDLQKSIMVNTTFNGRGQNLQDQQILFKEQIDIILQEREKTIFVGGTIEELEILQFEEWQQNLVAYTLTKLVTILASTVKNAIQNPKKNIFKFKNCEHFCKSQIALSMVDEFQKDIDQWNSKFLLYFFSIDASEIQDNQNNKEKILNFLDDNNGDRVFLTFDEIKIPMRLILDPIFKICYKLGKQNPVNSKKRAKLLRISLMILLCMLVNNYFKPTMLKNRFKLYFKENEEWDMSNFITWIKTAKSDDLENQIYDIIQVAFGQEALNRLKITN